MNNLYEWAVSQTLRCNEDFIESCNAESDEGYFLKIDVKYPKKLHDLHSDLLFLSARMKIEQGGKLIANYHDKEEYFIHMRNVKQVLNHEFVLRKCIESLILIGSFLIG